MHRQNYERDIILYLTINKLSYLNLKHPQCFKYVHSLKQLTANPKIEQTLHKRLQHTANILGLCLTATEILYVISVYNENKRVWIYLRILTIEQVGVV